MTGEANYGQVSGQPVVLGDLMDLLDCILKLSAQAQSSCGFINDTLFDELQYLYDCRLVNMITIHREDESQPQVPDTGPQSDCVLVDTGVYWHS